MKKLFYLFLVVIVGCGHNKSLNKKLQLENQRLKQQLQKFESDDTSQLKAVVELSKMNVVYRGVRNPLSISVPNSAIFEASAPGLRKIDDNGNYILSPGSGNEVLIDIRAELINGNKFRDTKAIRIKDIGRPIGTLNGIGHGENYLHEITKAELKNATIGVKFEDFIHDYKFIVTEFQILNSDSEILIVDGSMISGKAFDYINDLAINSIIVIRNIKHHILGVTTFKLKAPTPIKVKIIG